MKKLWYKGTHRYSFRSGEWGEVIGMTYLERWCYIIQYANGVLDYAAIVDKDNYELKEEAK